MQRSIRYLLLALVLVLVAMSSALIAMRFAIHGREVAVPKLIGMSQPQAENAAHAAGLMLAVQNRFYSNDVPEGKILSQLPAPQEKVRTGWVVRVAQSLGPQHTQIPDVVGQSPRAAEINVRRRGLEIGSVAVTNIPDANVEEIVAQSPMANATGFVSPRLSVLVSSAPVPRQYVMPSFIGKHLSQASDELEAAGFKLGEVTELSTNASRPTGGGDRARSVSIAAPAIIVKQNPAPGQKILAGATISFEVAR